MREPRSDSTLSPPVVQVRADSELALASMLGLGPRKGSLHGDHLPPGVVLGLVFALALAFALLGLDAVL